MKIVHLKHPYDPKLIEKSRVVLVLGFFDGVHLGHRALIEAGREKADQEGIPLAVMTFNRHPGIVFSDIHPRDIHYLTTAGQKQEEMEKLGVDLYYEVEFTSAFGSLKPEDFIDQYIAGLNAAVVVAGYDYTFGPPQETDMALMEELADNRFEVITIEEQRLDSGEEISSTAVRRYLMQGEIEKANQLLGRPFETTGYVIHGMARGRELGYPTANVYPDQDLLIPAIGVYASRVCVQGRWHDAMTSIGYNITFGDSKEYTIEVHILDFDQAIYGENVTIRWYEYMRGEEKFDTVEDLTAQLAEDEVKTREILRNY